MVLKAFSGRHDITIFDRSKSFRDEITEISEENCFSFAGGFDLYHTNADDKRNGDDIAYGEDFKPGEIAATVRCTFFDEDKILNEGQNIVYIADLLDGNLYGAMSALTGSEMYKKDLDWDKACLPLFTCYIERIYVYPKFRKLGIARYILSNLEDILWHCFNTPVHCFVTRPYPQIPDDNDDWDDAPDDNGKMRNKMIEVIEKSGFKQLGTSEYYALNCAAAK